MWYLHRSAGSTEFRVIEFSVSQRMKNTGSICLINICAYFLGIRNKSNYNTNMITNMLSIWNWKSKV